MVEVAKEFIEAVDGGQVVIAITLVVFAELSGGVAEAFENGGNGHIGFLPAFFCTREADFGHACADGNIAAEESGATGGAALLSVIVGEGETFAGDAVDVGGFVTHHAAVVVADVPGADIVTPDDEDIWFFAGLGDGR